MIFDERLEFADYVGANMAAGNRIFGDVVDLGASPTLQDIGSGSPVYLVIQSQSALAGAGNITLELKSDSTADLATSATTHATTGTAVYTVWPALTTVVIPLPDGVVYERYLGMWYTNSGTISGGNFNCFLTQTPAKYTAFNDGI